MKGNSRSQFRAQTSEVERECIKMKKSMNYFTLFILFNIVLNIIIILYLFSISGGEMGSAFAEAIFFYPLIAYIFCLLLFRSVEKINDKGYAKILMQGIVIIIFAVAMIFEIRYAVLFFLM